MFILIVGPKGSGKSHIGRILERRLGVHFFHVEPLWIGYHVECKSSGRDVSIAEGIARIHPLIAAALRHHEHVCVETTGASREILDDLLSLAPREQTLVVRVTAPVEVCLERIAARNQTEQIPMDVESIREVHALSENAGIEPDVVLRNVDLTEEAIVSAIRPLLS